MHKKLLPENKQTDKPMANGSLGPSALSVGVPGASHVAQSSDSLLVTSAGQ